MQVTGIEKVINGNGYTNDIINAVVSVYEKDHEQAKEFANQFRGKNEVETCRNLFWWVVQHIAYKIDPVGVQMVKTPGRTVADGTADCKSMTILIASCLRSLNIKHVIRFAGYNGGDFTHVYTVAYIDGKQITVDPVVRVQGRPMFNYEEKFTKKQDMQGTKVVYMAGIGGAAEDYSQFWTPNRQLAADEHDQYILLEILFNELEFARKNNDATAYDMISDRIDAIWLNLVINERVHVGELDATKAAKVINYLGLSGAFDHGQNREGFARDAKLVTASLLTQFYNVYSLEEVPQIGTWLSQFGNWVGEQANTIGGVFANAFSWVMKKVGQFAEWATESIFITQEMKNKAIADLTNNCEYFSYCFISDDVVGTYPLAVQNKRKTQMDVLTTYHKSGIIKTPDAMAVVESAIKAKYGKSLVDYFADLRSGKIAAVSGVAIGFEIAAMIAIITSIINVIKKLFGGKATTAPTDNQIKTSVPAYSDFPPQNNSTSDIMSVLPYVAVAAVGAGFLLTKKKSKKQ